MDADARRRRREEARRRTRRQRRIALAALLGLLALVVVWAAAGGGSSSGPSEQADASQQPEPQSELPRGGRSIFPEQRVVAFYGAPQDDELGALGIGTPAQAARRLERQARGYRRSGRPILPAFELIATVASGAPGDDGSYSFRQPKRVIRRYLAAARRAKALLILDVQPGRANFLDEVEWLREFLEEPDVSLALDPEWAVADGEIPGDVIGSVDAETVNAVSAMLAEIVERKRLPEKLLVVHQFTDDMIAGKERLARDRGVALTLNVDGFGDRPNKRAKYDEFTQGGLGVHWGFKLFYREDTNLFGPREVMRLKPRPELVVYE